MLVADDRLCPLAPALFLECFPVAQIHLFEVFAVCRIGVARFVFEAVWDELAEAADLWVCAVYEDNNTMYFNGNDAMVLRKISTNAAIDIFGKIGEDPGETGWAEMTQYVFPEVEQICKMKAYQ